MLEKKKIISILNRSVHAANPVIDEDVTHRTVTLGELEIFLTYVTAWTLAVVGVANMNFIKKENERRIVRIVKL